MTPDPWSWDRLDTDLRYAALMAPRRRRAALAALMAVWADIAGVPRTVTDPGVAAHKLGWWREELARMAGGRARHPGAQALAPHLDSLHDAPSRLEDVVAASLEETGLQRVEHLRDLEQLGARQAGPLLALAAELLGAGGSAPSARMAGALKVLEAVRDTGWLARRDRLLLPRREMERTGVHASDVLQRRAGEAFGALVGELGAHAARSLQAGFEAVPAAERRAWRPAAALAAVAVARQRQIEADPATVLDARIDLPPVRKLWVAWRGW